MRTTTVKIALPERSDLRRTVNAARRGIANVLGFAAKRIAPKPAEPTLDELKQPASAKLCLRGWFDEPAEMIGRLKRRT